MRFSDRTGPDALIKLMTDGILLAETQSDRRLDQYEVIIIDEAHERSLNIDFLLGYLKRLLPRRPDLKLIITSATIDPERFSRHFGDAPIIEVSGRTYPVALHYRPLPATDEDERDRDLQQAILDAVDEVWQQGRAISCVPGLANGKSARPPRACVQASSAEHRDSALCMPGYPPPNRIGYSSARPAAHRAGHQCRRNFVDRARHPLRDRSGTGAYQLLQPAQPDSAAAGKRFPGQRQSTRRSLRAGNGGRASGCTRKRIFRPVRPSPIRKSCAPYRRRSFCR